MTKNNLFLIFSILFFVPMFVVASEETKNDKYYASIQPNNFHIYYIYGDESRKRKLPIKKEDEELFAIGKFQYTQGITAYITQRDTDHGLGILLTLVDQSTGKRITGIDGIANAEGENDGTYEVESWLLDVNSDGYLDIVKKSLVIRRASSHNFWFKCQASTSIYLYSPTKRQFDETKTTNVARFEHLVMKQKQYGRSGYCKKKEAVAYTPKRGTLERKAILDSIRKRLGISYKFIVSHLKVKEVNYSGDKAFIAYFEGIPLISKEFPVNTMGRVMALLELMPASRRSWNSEYVLQKSEGWRVHAAWSTNSQHSEQEFRKVVKQELKAADAVELYKESNRKQEVNRKPWWKFW